MKKVLLVCLVCSCSVCFAQDKFTPAVKQGTRFAYVIHTGGQDVNFASFIDSVAAGYLKLGWDIDGLGSGGWIMKKNSLETATNGYWDQPMPGSDVELSGDQTVLILSKLQWESIQKEKKLLFDQTNFLVKAPSDQQLLKLQGKTVDAIMLETPNGYRLWVLNNPSFPFILKIEGNPKGIDIDLASID